MSNIVHKVKDALTGHKEHDTTTGTSNTTTNPNYYSSGSTNAGPHDSSLGNKLDPRIDSDRDGSYTVGTGNTGTGTYGSTGMTGTGMTGTGNTYSQTSGGHGPHSSGLANRVDPRVDSTTGTANTGSTGIMGSTGMGTTGAGYNHSSTAGPHSSNVANKVDPRVDSDRDGSYTMGAGNTGTYGSTTTGTGMGMGGTHGHNHKTTAGPHKSDMANKLDPRVDSDLDGSRTVGGPPKY